MFDLSSFSDNKLRYWTMVLTIALSILGLVVLLSSSIGKEAEMHRSLAPAATQLIAWIAGMSAMYVLNRCGSIGKIRSLLVWPLTLLTFALLIWAGWFSEAINDVHRWISYKWVSFQPSELAKLGLIFFWADCLSRNSSELIRISNPGSRLRTKKKRSAFGLSVKSFCIELIGGIWRFLVICKIPLIVTFVYVVLFERGSDMGTSFLMSVVILFMIFMVGFSRKVMFTLAAVIFFVVLNAVLYLDGINVSHLQNNAIENYRVKRMVGWRHLDYDPEGVNYQVHNALAAISCGGLFGVGIPYSLSKFNFVPEMHCDFIYSIFAEEMGLLGVLGMFGFFFALGVFGFTIANRSKSEFLSLAAFGITAQIICQLLYNVSVVTGLAPNKGLPLPFLSHGGSSLLMSFISVGILLNIIHHNESGDKCIEEKQSKKKGASIAVTSDSSYEQHDNISGDDSGDAWEAASAPLDNTAVYNALPKPPIRCCSWSSEDLRQLRRSGKAGK